MTVPAHVAMVEQAHALIVTPHVVSLSGQRKLSAAEAEFTQGESLASLLERQGVVPGQWWRVAIDGHFVPEAMWAYTRPKHGYLIECRRVPHKDALRIIAVAALSYFTFGTGGLAGGSFMGLTGAAGAFAAGAVFLAGSLVINKMLAPKMPGRGGAGDQGSSPTYGLTAGGRNRIRAFEPMGVVLGEPYAVPDMGAQPYTFFAGGEQYLWQIFHLGINCADVSALRVGQTPLSFYQGVTLLRNGLASGNSALPALGSSVDTVAGAVLEGTNGKPWTTRTTSVGTVYIALDFVAQLFATTNDGAFATMVLDVEIQIRAVGTDNWLPFTDPIAGVPAVTRVVTSSGGDDSGDWTREYIEVITPEVPAVPAGVLRLRNASQKPVRVSIGLAVGGQYEVRVRKSSDEYTGTQGSNQVEWAQMRSYQRDLANYDGQSRLAIQIQASGQLNGTLDEVNAVLRSKPMPFWNGSAWVTATDRASGLCNPGALFLLLARGIRDSSGRLLAGAGKSDDEIDIEGLKRFMVRCTARGFDFDYFMQETMSLQDLLDAIAYAGMGEVGYPDGKFGVVFFSEDDPLEGVINMANIKARSFQVDYETMPAANEIEVQYFDRFRGNAWRSLRVVAPGETNPSATARMPLTGVTSEAHAAILGRFAMAQNVFQRKTVTLEMDLEYMTYRRGAVVSLSHDLTQWGYSGRLVAAQDIGGEIHLTLDEKAPGEIPVGGSGRYIGLRLPGERQPRVFPVKSFAGESRAVVLDAAWPVGVPLPGSADNPAHDTIWVYDFKSDPGQRLLVASIEPSTDGARLTLVPIGPEFWTYVYTGAYIPPPNTSRLRPPPVVSGAAVTEALARQGNTFYTELQVSFSVTGAFNRAELWGAVGDGMVAPTRLSLLDTSTSQSLNWRGGLDERWHLEVRVFSDLHAATPYRMIYDVEGLREPPPNVEAISISGDTVSWPAVSVPDLAGYLIRFNYGVNYWWSTATPMHEGVVTASPYVVLRRPEGLVSVGIKAIDTTGNESAEAVWVSYVFPEVPVENVLIEFPQSPTFPGVVSGGVVVGGELLAADVDSFYDPPGGPMYAPADEPAYAASQFGTLVYEFDITAASPGLLKLLYEIEGDSYLIEYQTGGGEPFYGTPDSDPMWLPSDELAYGPPSAWSVWPGSIEVDGAIQARFRITISGGELQGAIRYLDAVLDVPDVTELLEGVEVAPGGTRLPITKPYTAVRTARLTVLGGGTGVSARLIDKNPTLGPQVEILNASGTAVAGSLDAEIQGY